MNSATMSTSVPAVGSAAPDFTIAATNGEQITLSSFHGKQNVLLAFFPLAFTGTCTAEVCAFTDDYAAFTSKDVTVLPISVDSVPSLKEFKAKYQLSVDLASDFRRDVARAYGVLHEERFFCNRAYFLVDKSGVVRWAFVEANPSTRRENAEILAEIAKLG